MLSRFRTIVVRTFLGVLWAFTLFLAVGFTWVLVSSRWSDRGWEARAEIGAQHRRMASTAQLLADAYSRAQARYRAEELDDEQLFDLALSRAAEQSTITLEELKATLRSFDATVAEDPDPDPIDAALAAFARLDFEGAAVLPLGGHREGLRLRGQALTATRDFHGALAAYDAAIELTSRSEEPELWGNLQYLRGETAALAGGEGDLEVAVEAFGAALDVFDVDTPDWKLPMAMALNERAACWVMQAKALGSEGETDLVQAVRATMAAKAAKAHRTAAKAFKSMSEEQWRAHAQTDLAEALSWCGAYEAGATERALLAADERFEEATQALSSALLVQRRDECPEDWARNQRRLADLLCQRAHVHRGDFRAELLAEGKRAYKHALSVFNQETHPYWWYRTADELSVKLKLLATSSQGFPERLVLLEEAFDWRLAILDHTPRETDLQRWTYMQLHVASIQLDLFDALGDQSADRDRRLGVIEDAMARLREVIELTDDSVPPRNGPAAQQNLAVALHRRASLETGSNRASWLDQAAAAGRRYLSVHEDAISLAEQDRFQQWVDAVESEAADLR